MRGRFITFEGPEGSGKSTQAGFLVEYLKSKRKKAVFLREPGGTELSEKIRKILLGKPRCRRVPASRSKIYTKSNQEIYPLAEMFLYLAARAQLIQEQIKPALKKGYFVVCDRFLDSTIAYQGYGLGIDLSLIEYVGNFLISEVKPDLTIFLDLAVSKGLNACGRKLDRIEQRSLAYHQRVRRGYLKLAFRFPGRIKIIIPDKDKNKTQAKIRKIIEENLL